MPKKPSPKSICDLCCDALKQGEDQLVCEGGCGSKIHRYWTGVTTKHYAELTTTSSYPFICKYCSLKQFKAVVTQLQSEIITLKNRAGHSQDRTAMAAPTPSSTQNLELSAPSEATRPSYASVALSAAARHKLSQLESELHSKILAAKSSHEANLIHSFAGKHNNKIYDYIRSLSSDNSIPSQVVHQLLLLTLTEH